MADIDVSRMLNRSMLPAFTLQRADGGEFSTWSYKGSKNLVVFVFGKVCNPDCRTLLAQVAREYREYQAMNTEVVAVFRANRESADEIKHELNLPFPVVADVEGLVAPALSHELPAVLITDRYGEIVAEYRGSEMADVKHEQILAQVELNELECPE